MNLLVWWCALLLAAAAVGDAQPAPAPALSQFHSTYDVQSTLVLDELQSEHRDRDVGYRLNGSLTMEPVAVDHDQHRLLLKFRLRGMELQLRGAGRRAEYARRSSLWDAHAQADGAFYALLQAGRLRAAYLDARDPPDVLNYKRALLSLFQFQVEDGEHKETDISGECDVSYETLSPTVFRKIKRRCAFEAGPEGVEGVEGEEEDGVRARRVSRYTLAQGAVAALHAEEVVWARAAAGAAVQARSWHALARRGGARARPAAGPAALDAALAALPAALADTPLPLPLADDADDDDDDEDEESLESALETHRAALEGWEAGGGGSLAAARALGPLLRAARAASEAALRAELAREPARLPGLCRALGLAGSHAAWRAARALLAPAARDALQPLTHHYLAGFAQALAPQEETVAEILTLGEEAKLPSIAEAALLAGAAAASRCGERAQLQARDRLSRGLARARSGPARAVRLLAIGNLRRRDTAPLLLAAAERGAAEDARAALEALRRAPPAALGVAQLERAARLAENASLPLETRALALELAVERLCASEMGDTVPLALVRLARALLSERGARAHELRRALWQRLETLEPRAAVRALRRVLPRDLAAWAARAHGGSSSVLRRALPWRGGGWRAVLHSSQLASRALLRRGRVALAAAPLAPLAPGAARADTELLAVEVWTRGLEAIAGGGGAEVEAGEEADEEPAAGLRLSVGGAALPGVTLFSGRAELVGHVWAGTGAAPTPVLRALLPLRTWRARAPLQAGARLRLRAEASGALALDASAAVSLWQREARARLSLRAAAHATTLAEVRTDWSRLRARATAGGAARLRVAPALEFHEAVALCVRAELAPHATERALELRAAGGVRRGRAAVLRRAGGSLALGRENDAACRALGAEDLDDDDE